MIDEEASAYQRCFTGHRPDKLLRSEEDIRCDLKEAILSAMDAGIATFISGMAKGVDLWAAEIALDLKKENTSIKLVCALPNQEWLQRCNGLCNKADAVVIIGNGHHPGIYQLCNQWMVDHSARVIAVYNGQPGGTKSTIDYANKVGALIHLIQG